MQQLQAPAWRATWPLPLHLPSLASPCGVHVQLDSPIWLDAGTSSSTCISSTRPDQTWTHSEAGRSSQLLRLALGPALGALIVRGRKLARCAHSSN